jgi:hypothetical protein
MSQEDQQAFRGIGTTNDSVTESQKMSVVMLESKM